MKITGSILITFFGFSMIALAAPIGEERIYKKIDNRDLKLYVVKPSDWKPGEARPAIVLFHGGGWTGGKPSQFDSQCQYLVTRGMVCVQVEYRLLNSKESKELPIRCIQDAKSAMRWVRAHAKELGIDPKRIAAGGGSAGGHLAAFVGMVEGMDDPLDYQQISPKANALVLFNPVFDNGPDNGWGSARVGDRYKEFSPAHNITADDPPAIIFLGSQDKLIPVSIVERFRDRMLQASVQCKAVFYEGQAHGFFNRDPFLTITLIEVDKFLASLGWLQGPPTLKSGL